VFPCAGLFGGEDAGSELPAPVAVGVARVGSHAPSCVFVQPVLLALAALGCGLGCALVAGQAPIPGCALAWLAAHLSSSCVSVRVHPPPWIWVARRRGACSPARSSQGVKSAEAVALMGCGRLPRDGGRGSVCVDPSPSPYPRLRGSRSADVVRWLLLLGPRVCEPPEVESGGGKRLAEPVGLGSALVCEVRPAPGSEARGDG